MITAEASCPFEYLRAGAALHHGTIAQASVPCPIWTDGDEPQWWDGSQWRALASRAVEHQLRLERPARPLLPIVFQDCEAVIAHEALKETRVARCMKVAFHDGSQLMARNVGGRDTWSAVPLRWSDLKPKLREITAFEVDQGAAYFFMFQLLDQPHCIVLRYQVDQMTWEDIGLCMEIEIDTEYMVLLRVRPESCEIVVATYEGALVVHHLPCSPEGLTVHRFSDWTLFASADQAPEKIPRYGGPCFRQFLWRTSQACIPPSELVLEGHVLNGAFPIAYTLGEDVAYCLLSDGGLCVSGSLSMFHEKVFRRSSMQGVEYARKAVVLDRVPAGRLPKGQPYSWLLSFQLCFTLDVNSGMRWAPGVQMARSGGVICSHRKELSCVASQQFALHAPGGDWSPMGSSWHTAQYRVDHNPKEPDREKAKRLAQEALARIDNA
mmetsp:Transcript_28159/g.62098  ORF Transcript_28159/g.62098 Transcript_28159/m.62098 type:complete len:437 (+) Transcript_28159:68-1378(+)